ncbi:TRAP transporter small permease [Pusillimonas noertemannii]|uniref:TRAP transporter small permease protein n=1 Tax=Pusillimonas noertemannii TaxID=305977 RepID=A0A2U1CQX7_9BURK|nr:TRAP transporter small permease [Pusillimonas noertemannii]NYT67607.1 TRAP transporter small permease [Pusillimonas noertemannii]PVY68279.1 TRAP-type C4-dicarboxylate transport system permease small subunit [Pusillimonas noertemannii]TFL12227.1 TRAP transporter small permease [Pusillimonas noertemannii]
MTIIGRVSRGYNATVFSLAAISGTIFGCMAFLIGMDVLLRNVSGTGLNWVVESMEYALYGATIFAAPWVLRTGGHVSVDIVTSSLPAGWGRRVEIAAGLLGGVICTIVFYYSLIATWRAFERGSLVYKTFTIPEWWISALVPFCMFFMIIEFSMLLKARKIDS